MHRTPRKHASTATVIFAALALGACTSEPETTEAAPVEGVLPGVTVSEARLVLPPVSGNPAAIYLTLTNDGDRLLTINGVEVSGAKSAAIHKVTRYNMKTAMATVDPLHVKTGETKTFEPGGLHVMAFELDETLEAGGSVEVTFDAFSGPLKFTAPIQAAGDER